jgi:hypothetical protein
MMEEIEKFQKMIDNATADGRLSYEESEMIRIAIYKNKKNTREKVIIWRELQMKIVSAEILLD